MPETAGKSDGLQPNSNNGDNSGGSTPVVPTPPPGWTSRQIPAELQPDLGPVVDGNTASALDLHDRVKSQPGSISTAWP